MMNRKGLHSELRTIRFLLSYVLRYKKRLVWVVLCSLVVSVLSVGSLTMLMPVVETIFEQREQVGALSRTPGKLHELLSPFYRIVDTYAHSSPFGTLLFACCCYLTIVAMYGGFRYLHEYMSRWIGHRVIIDLQRDLFDRLTYFNAAYFARNKVGSILSYFTVDVRVIGLTVINAFGRLLLEPCVLLISIAALLYLQWKLTLLYMLIFPLLLWTIRFFALKNRRAARNLQAYLARIGAFLQEHFSHIRLVQGYEMYGHQQRRFETEIIGTFRASMGMVKAKAISSPLNEFIGLAAACVILILGGYFILIKETLYGSEFVVYLAILGTIYQPIKRIEHAIQEIQHGFAAAERIFDALATEATLPDRPDAYDIQSFVQSIRFERIVFSYEPEQIVLNEISFTAQKGEVVALVGPSGAGKTTLVNLIPRFYDPVDGSVLIDGYDLRDLRISSLRRLMSIVPQDVLIFADTIRLNITCGEECYSEEQVRSAAQAAFAHDFISSLPHGYDTIVGERGVSLSGGQCQRLALARAFLRNAPILILDEATSSLDSESERHIKRSLQSLMQGRTTFVIAHRLSTILYADKIVVLDRGRIVDLGSHAELLERCSLYRRLYELQFLEEEMSPSTDSIAQTAET